MTETTPLPAAQAWRALAAMMIGFFMLLLDTTIVAVATPQFQEQLGASLNAVVWVTSAYFLTGAIPLLVTGRLGDRYGQRKMYLVGVSLFTASSLWCGLSSSVEMLIAARALQGLGGAIIAPQILSVITRIFPPQKRGTAMGIWGMVAGLASLMGPLLGGIIVGFFSWHWVFIINVPIGLISLVMTSKWLPHLPCTSRKIDIPSVLVSMVSVFCIVFGLQQGQALGWPVWSWFMIAIGIALTGLFLLMQWLKTRAEGEALVPLHLFMNRNFSVGSFTITSVGFAMGGFALPLMIYLQRGVGLPAEQAGIMLLPMALISGVLSPLTGGLSDRLHPRVLLVFGFAAMALGFLSASFIMRSGVSFWWILVSICLQGVGSSFIWSPNSAAAMRDIDPAVSGAASGVYNTTRQVGSVLGAAAVGALMQWGVSTSSVSVAMGTAMLAPSLSLVIGFVAVFFLTDSPNRIQPQA